MDGVNEIVAVESETRPALRHRSASLPGFHSNTRRWLVLTFAIISLAVTGYLDILTGPEFSLALLYLIPVFLVAWYVGPVPGYIAAVLSAAMRHLAELKGAATYTNSFNVYWNGSVRIIFFVIVAGLISALRSSGTRLETLVRLRTASIRRLGIQLAEAEEAERRSLAHDMHDGLSQSLLLLKMNLDAIKDAIPESLPDQRKRLLESISNVDGVLQQTRTLMFDLHPSMLDELGFVPTLRRYAEQFGKQTHIDVAITESGASRPLARSLGHHLFRAVKELLSNAVRHGRAKEILVAVHWEPAELRVVVDDDGCGFDVATRLSSTSGTSLGLVGIEERLASLGGAFHIESVVGQGSRAVIEVTLEGS